MNKAWKILEASFGLGKSGDYRFDQDLEDLPSKSPMKMSRNDQYHNDWSDSNDKKSRRDHLVGSPKIGEEKSANCPMCGSETNSDLGEAVGGMDTFDIGAGVSGTDPTALDEPIKLTIGKKQLSFTADDMVELIKSGELQKMIQAGKIRKLPGV